MICCNTSNYDCMARECGICRDRVIEFSSHRPINEEAVVVWSEWTTVNKEYQKDGQSKTAKVNCKRIKRGSLGELKATFDVCLLLNGTSALFRPLVPRIVEVEMSLLEMYSPVHVYIIIRHQFGVINH